MMTGTVGDPHTEPILTAPLFEELDTTLVELLESLSSDEWRLATVVPKWTVKQIAAHLLDTALRRLSLVRDREPGPDAVIANDRDLATFVNGLNAKGVEVYGSLSPRLLIEWTGAVVGELHDYLTSLDPMAPARWSVSWAGERRSANWFDIARERTERWHHQQQIRLSASCARCRTRIPASRRHRAPSAKCTSPAAAAVSGAFTGATRPGHSPRFPIVPTPMPSPPSRRTLPGASSRRASRRQKLGRTSSLQETNGLVLLCST
jgi:Mycothiol maleylpyruvate isomerase N-terminal domain